MLLQSFSHRVLLLCVSVLPSFMIAVLTSAVCCVPCVAAEESSSWTLQTVPDSWRSVPKDALAPINGYSWYRALVRIPADWKNAEIRMYVEALDDARSTWINGTTLGVTGTFPPQFRSGLGERGQYPVNSDTLRLGDLNTVAIRVFQSDPRPNFSVAPPVLVNLTSKVAIRMEGSWQYRPGDDSRWASASPGDFEIDPEKQYSDNDALAKGLFQRVDTVDDVDKYVARRNGDTDPLPPQEAVRHFLTPSDLAVQLVVGDPDIAQPLFMMWDERSRLWVMEYRQYPDPAGLTMLSRDTFLRSVYDKVPAAPPNHVRGHDRISIHEDRDGDGVCETHQTFLDGLNIASSFALADGGVYVANPPYLLFYADRNRDDVPDGDPEVLLEGFGIEDSHYVINSLRVGPDGWLYGAQGSTVTAAVKKPGSKEPPIRSVGQNIWRYHPRSGVYEVFAEGGGNTFGCEIDSRGRIFSGHNGGDTRGFHYVQGGYYRKGFGKHGPLSNPYAFGFFEHIRHHSAARFSHNFIIYEENRLPDAYRGKLFGIEPLQGQVVLSDFQPYQSSFETRDLERVLKTDDPWFRPVDIKCGPDGCVYIADMYEQRIDHSSHYAGRIDRTNGRIYRLKPANSEKLPMGSNTDLGRCSTTELIRKLQSPDRWHRQTALRLLCDRSDPSVLNDALSELNAAHGQLPLELCWASYTSGLWTSETVNTLLKHPVPSVREWTVRLAADQPEDALRFGPLLAEIADHEPDIHVRKQLACSARRLSPDLSLNIVERLSRYDQDAEDIHQPLLLWWAVENAAGRTTASRLISAFLSEKDVWHRPLVYQHILQRLMRRYAATGTRADLTGAAELLNAAPDRECSERLLAGFEEAYAGRSLADLPEELAAAITATGGGSLPLRLRQGQESAFAEATTVILSPTDSAALKSQLIEILGQTARSENLPLLLSLLKSETDGGLLSAVLTALQPYEDSQIADLVINRLPELNGDPLFCAETLLSSRQVWSLTLLAAVDTGKIRLQTVSEPALRKMLLHNNAEINDLIRKHRGSVAGASTVEMQADINRVSDLLNAGSGNPRVGKTIFMMNCGRCHQLFEEGGKIGPDLTPFARDNTDRLLKNIINPGLEIREGFENHLILTVDGRILNGFLADKDSQFVILRGIDGQNITIRQSDIDDMRVLPLSVMPEGSLKGLSDQQIRDLFAYLRSSQPVNY